MAYFGTYGYELDLNLISGEEILEARKYTQFMKDHRELIQYGTFYRLSSPFEGNIMAWMVVNEDRTEAIVGRYRMLNHPNEPFSRLKLAGLDPDTCYEVIGPDVYTKNAAGEANGKVHYGDELMRAGLVISEDSSGKTGSDVVRASDFSSQIFLIRKREEV